MRTSNICGWFLEVSEKIEKFPRSIQLCSYLSRTASTDLSNCSADLSQEWSRAQLRALFDSSSHVLSSVSSFEIRSAKASSSGKVPRSHVVPSIIESLDPGTYQPTTGVH